MEAAILCRCSRSLAVEASLAVSRITTALDLTFPASGALEAIVSSSPLSMRLEKRGLIFRVHRQKFLPYRNWDSLSLMAIPAFRLAFALLFVRA